MVEPLAGSGRVSRGWTRTSSPRKPLLLIAIGLAGLPVMFRLEPSHPGSASVDGFTLAGHERAVLGVVFSPDGRFLATCGADATVRLWDTGCWRAGRTTGADVLPHPSEVQAMAFSPDGSLLATSGLGYLWLWSLDRPDVRRFPSPGSPVHSLAFSPDGRTLALGDEDGSIRLWEMPEGRERAILRGPAETLHCLAYAPGGTLLASGSDAGRVVLRGTGAGGPTRVLLQGSGKPIRSVAFSPDGRTLGVAEPAGAGDALLFDVETGGIRSRLPGDPGGIVALAYSPDGRLVATGGIDRTIKLWRPDTPEVLSRLRDGLALKSLAFSPDGRWLARASSDELVRILDMSAWSRAGV